MNKKENGLPRAIKALVMTNKGTFSYPTKIREEGKNACIIPANEKPMQRQNAFASVYSCR